MPFFSVYQLYIETARSGSTMQKAMWIFHFLKCCSVRGKEYKFYDNFPHVDRNYRAINYLMRCSKWCLLCGYACCVGAGPLGTGKVLFLLGYYVGGRCHLLYV